MRSQRVAVTGIGVIAPGGTGIEAFRALLREGRSAVTEIRRFDTANLRAHTAALVDDFRPKDFIPVMKMRRMNVLSRLGVAATKLALDDAGGNRHSGGDVGVSVGTTFGPVQTSIDYLQEYIAKGPALAPPQLFAESVANAPGSHIAIEHRYEGFNLTFTQRESSALTALMYASSQIVKGTAKAAISGGVEEINEMIFSVLDRIGTLAHAEGGVPEGARPFDAKRNGMVVGEGAGMFLLENAADAREEKVWGWFSGFAAGRDITATISDWGTGAEAVARVMRDAIDDAGVAPGEIAAIFASANSGVRADRLEARALREVFGRAVPPVVAPKAAFGEYAGGGALQIAAALVAMRDQQLPPTLGFEVAEPGLEIPLNLELRDFPMKHILVASLSAGGGIIAAVISRSCVD